MLKIEFIRAYEKEANIYVHHLEEVKEKLREQAGVNPNLSDSDLEVMEIWQEFDNLDKFGQCPDSQVDGIVYTTEYAIQVKWREAKPMDVEALVFEGKSLDSALESLHRHVDGPVTIRRIWKRL